MYTVVCAKQILRIITTVREYANILQDKTLVPGTPPTTTVFILLKAYDATVVYFVPTHMHLNYAVM